MEKSIEDQIADTELTEEEVAKHEWSQYRNMYDDAWLVSTGIFNREEPYEDHDSKIKDTVKRYQSEDRAIYRGSKTILVFDKNEDDENWRMYPYGVTETLPILRLKRRNGCWMWIGIKRTAPKDPKATKYAIKLDYSFSVPKRSFKTMLSGKDEIDMGEKDEAVKKKMLDELVIATNLVANSIKECIEDNE
jgi:hypothetical protein